MLGFIQTLYKATLVLILPIVLIAVGYLYVCISNRGNSIIIVKDIVEAFRHEVVIPPGDYFGPGTIFTVDQLPNGSLDLRPTCDINGDIEKQWKHSPLTKDEIMRKYSDEYGASTSWVGMLNAVFNGNRVNTTISSVNNAETIYLTDEDLIKIRKLLVKGTCEEAIIHNLNAGRTSVFQSASVLQADISILRS